MISANLPWVESPFFEAELKLRNLSEEKIKLVDEYHRNGFVVLQDLLPQSLIGTVREEVERKAFNLNFPLTTKRDD